MRPNEIVLLIMTLSIFLTVYVEVAVLMALPIYIFATKQGFIFRRRRYDVVFLSIFWVLSMVVTLLNKPGALDIAMGVMMVFAFIAMIFTCYAMTQRMFRLIISICCFMSPVCFAIALIQQGMGLVWDYGERYCSVFTNPNYYAFYISLVILFCIYSSIKSEGAGAKAAFLLLIPINLAALYLTECRTTFIVLLAVCPIMLCYCDKKRWLVIYLAVFAAFFTAALLLEDKLELLPRTGRDRRGFQKTHGHMERRDKEHSGRAHIRARLQHLYAHPRALRLIRRESLAQPAFRAAHGLWARRLGLSRGVFFNKHRKDHRAAPFKQVPPPLRL